MGDRDRGAGGLRCADESRLTPRLGPAGKPAGAATPRASLLVHAESRVYPRTSEAVLACRNRHRVDDILG